MAINSRRGVSEPEDRRHHAEAAEIDSFVSEAEQDLVMLRLDVVHGVCEPASDLHRWNQSPAGGKGSSAATPGSSIGSILTKQRDREEFRVAKFLSVPECRRRDSNPHASRRHPLKMVCLPIPPLRLTENLIRRWGSRRWFRSCRSRSCRRCRCRRARRVCRNH
jgi:hypothetical protein